jgi:lysophospholipase L1-like esterase
VRTSGILLKRAIGVLAASVALVIGSVGAAGAVAPPGDAPRAALGGPTYDVSLGDSLAQGVQPDENGTSVPTDQGYADDLFATERGSYQDLRLVKLGCPGETTTSMIAGGICHYGHGSQLAAAASFLHAHRNRLAFVTIDIGANNVDGCVRDGQIDVQCLQAGFAAAQADLPVIMSTLRQAAGPNVSIIGMSYYDPFLAAWLSGPDGQVLAQESVVLTVQFNALLGSIYAAAGSPVADVEGTFATTDFIDMVFLPGFGLVPLNVFDVCVWTWMCAPSPRGPNIHANAVGYERIAGAFAALL